MKKSKCCNAEVKEYNETAGKYFACTSCMLPCEVIEKKEERPAMYIPSLPTDTGQTMNGIAIYKFGDISLNPDLIDFLSKKFAVPETVIKTALETLPPRIRIFHMLKSIGKESVFDDLINEVSKT